MRIKLKFSFLNNNVSYLTFKKKEKELASFKVILKPIALM